MTTTCPAGHPSTTDDYCDTCGASMGASPRAAGTLTPCPGCGDPTQGRFCESCGYDIEVGAAAAPSVVTLTLSADREHWSRMVGEGEPAFPDVSPSLTFTLDGEHATLGRVRDGETSDVDLALTGTAADAAVSHHQLAFARTDQGWEVRDTNSSNGTWINDSTEPLGAGEPHRLVDGDRLLIGAWTCLTVHITTPGTGG